MKKAITVIIAALYVVAIVIIAFFGSEIRAESKITHVTDIVLNLESYSIGATKVYDVNRNSKWEENKEENVKYTIVIRDYNYFFTSMGNGMQLNASAKPVDATISDLNYSIIVGEQYTQISETGAFAFTEKLTSSSAAQIKISSTDNSGVFIKVGIAAIVM